MHPFFKRRLRPIAIFILPFFVWMCIEPWNFAMAVQGPATVLANPRATSPSYTRNKVKTASESFEEGLRSIKQQIRSVTEGDTYQEQLQARLDVFRNTVTRFSQYLDFISLGLDRLALKVERGQDIHDEMNSLTTQEQEFRKVVGQIKMEDAALMSVMRGVPKPTGLIQSHHQFRRSFFTQTKSLTAQLQDMLK